MLQQFNTTTLASNLIKGLLANTSIPIWKCILINDYIIANNFYIFRNFVIKCTKSGVFQVSDLSAPIITPLNKHSVDFEVISNYDSSDKKYNYNFLSSYNYYDDQTHYHLGKYLKYLECTQDLNLFPFYNCYSGKTLSGYLDKDNEDNYFFNNTSNSETTNISYVIPITFNTTYTITYSSLTNSKIYCITNLNNPTIVPDSIKFTPPQSFNHPIKYSLTPNPNTDTGLSLLKKENELYLIIELDSLLKTSIVVLKGDYSQTKPLPFFGVKETTSKPETTYPSISTFTSLSKPSLLLFDSKNSYAFSNTLLEFLLTNTITQYDPIYKNISRLQKAFNIIYGPHYGINDLGNWSYQLEIDILKLYQEFELDWNCIDRSFTGIKIIEEFLTRKGIDLDAL